MCMRFGGKEYEQREKIKNRQASEWEGGKVVPQETEHEGGIE